METKNIKVHADEPVADAATSVDNKELAFKEGFMDNSVMLTEADSGDKKNSTPDSTSTISPNS